MIFVLLCGSHADRHSIFEGKGSKWRTPDNYCPCLMIVKNTIGIIKMILIPNYSMWQNINHAKLLLDSLNISIGIALPINTFPTSIFLKWNNVDVILTNSK